MQTTCDKIRLALILAQFNRGSYSYIRGPNWFKATIEVRFLIQWRVLLDASKDTQCFGGQITIDSDFCNQVFLLNSIISEHPQRPLFILWYDMSQDETFNFLWLNLFLLIYIVNDCKWCQCRKSRQCCSVCDRKELIDGGPTTFLYYSTSGKF